MPDDFIRRMVQARLRRPKVARFRHVRYNTWKKLLFYIPSEYITSKAQFSARYLQSVGLKHFPRGSLRI